MTGERRFVIDTNVLVSAALTRGGVPFQALGLAVRTGVLLLTETTYAELVEVLHRPRLKKYLSDERREAILEQVIGVSLHVSVEEPIAACQDPKDDKFLEAAVSGGADYLVSGDPDLLVLHPFRSIPILTPAAFLQAVEMEG